MHSRRMRTVRCSSHLPGGVYLGVFTGADAPLWTEFLAHARENITFPQLCLRTVKIQQLTGQPGSTHKSN